MILEVKKEKLWINISSIESIEKSGDMSVIVSMKSGKSHKIDYNPKSIVALCNKSQDEGMNILKNIDRNTFAPRI